MLSDITKFFLTRRGLLVAVGIGAVATASAAMPGTMAARVLIGLALTLMYASLAVLVAKEVVRQDVRLKRALREIRHGKRHDAPNRTVESPPSAQVQTSVQRLAPTTVREGAPDRGPLVSVIVTAHNEQRFLGAALESVRTQTWTNWECIIVDDASTDGTMSVALESTTADERFSVIHVDRNVGLAAARNVGLARAGGQFVTFLDGDDVMYSHAIERRLAAVLSCADPEWVAGAYVLWHQIPEDGELTDAPRRARRRGRVSWLDAVYDAPFIASAPLIRTSVLRTVGGFDVTARTAEDYDLWSRVLRRGYVFDAVNEVGIGYRQKRNSLYRRTSREHARHTTSIYRSSLESVQLSGGPYPLTEPYYNYEAEVAAFRRLVIGYVTAVASDDRERMELLKRGLGESTAPYLLRILDLERLVHRTALRLERWSAEALSTRVMALEHTVWSELEAIFGFAPGQRGPCSRAAEIGEADPVALPEVVVRSLRGLSPQSVVSAPESRRLMLMPESAYHVDELGPLAELAAAGGVASAFLVSDARLTAVADELRRFDVPVYTYPKAEPPVADVVRRASALVTMNDWGSASHIVEACNEAGIPTFGKVEGAQDFNDDDVHWTRNAYSRVATVLCQGRNDVLATSGDRVVVGSSRLERIFAEPEVVARHPLAVINVNFTYGVLAHARDTWVASATAACRRAGIPYVISAHPAETGKLTDPHVADVPMRHLLTRASVLISRFSTVPFEAMARGVPFIYHNPHGEKVRTFNDPDGAFRITRDVYELADALTYASTWQPGYRERARRFFTAQVDMEDRPSEYRTWEALARNVTYDAEDQ